MSPIKRNLVCFPLFFCLILLFIYACESKMADPEGTLRKQAEQYWTERLINKDYEYTYKEEFKDGLPPFSEYEKSLKFVTKFGVSSVRVEKIKIEGDQGTVTLQVACQLPRVPKAVDVPLGDRWVMKGNQWKHILEKKTK